MKRNRESPWNQAHYELNSPTPLQRLPLIVSFAKFSEAISAHCGLRSIARATKTASASPLAMMCSGCSGSVIRPTTAVGMLASVRMAVAKGRGSILLVAFLHARIPGD